LNSPPFFCAALAEIFRKVVAGHTGDAAEKVVEEFCLAIIKKMRKTTKLCPRELPVAMNAIVSESKVGFHKPNSCNFSIEFF